jgi:ribosomal protein L37AE/L43A
MNLRTAETEPAYQGSMSGAEAVLNVWLRKGEVPPHLPSGATVSVEVEVVANHGRWLVECPFCPSAQVASVSDRRFFCTDCGNAQVGGAFVKTVWPDDLVGLDDVLGQRPSANANWRSHETLERIRGENAAHGVGH